MPLLACALTIAALAPQADPVVLRTGFDDAPVGALRAWEAGGGRWTADEGHAEIHAAHHRSAPHALRILGGEERTVVLDLGDPPQELFELTFHAERWTARAPFAMRIDARDSCGWSTVWNGDRAVAVGRFASHVRIPLRAVGAIRALRFVATSPAESGVLIDDLALLRPAPMRIVAARQRIPATPVLVGGDPDPVLEIEVDVVGTTPARRIDRIAVSYAASDDVHDLHSLSVEADGLRGWNAALDGDRGEVLFPWPIELHHGTNSIRIVARAAADANLDHRVAARCTSLDFDDGPPIVPKLTDDSAGSQRLGVALRRAGEDGVHTSRIPALVCTAKGTLLAAFDLRHAGGGDLPGDIDVAVRRSTDGGRSWSAAAPALDLGEPHAENGVGDPCLLVDTVTDRVWLFSLWVRGNTAWHGSRPGLDVGVTGQLVATWSDDDGVTWSAPRNLTRALKDPAWRLLLQGPGTGITTHDGTLVIPAQFRDAEGLPHSTVAWSDDRGATWHIGSGARDDTTESAVVELADGRWMLNMRDNRGGARAVAVTADRGATWTEHPTSRTALPEPVCMASLVRFERGRQGFADDVLLFSNPAVDAPPRRHTTVRVSRDDGATWSAGVLLDAGTGAGYSSLARIDAATVGILYEGSRAQLTFQRLPLQDLFDSRSEPVGRDTP